jgi:UDPglucose--hexose-1-phosphate uridylyltransferase
MTRPEIRKDYIQEKYVILAPRRDLSKRPHDTEKPVCVNEPEKKRVSVFTPSALRKEKSLLTIGPEAKWKIKVVANKFPAVDPSFPKAYGHQEVVVETPDPLPELEDLSVAHISALLEAYADRTREISNDKRIEYILIFKNNGGRAGASLQHAHSQIFATEFLPPHLYDKSKRTHAYRISKGRCVYCDVIKKEKNGPRKIYLDEHIIAFCPYASMFNYETWIMPRRHLDNITDLNKNERLSWAKILKKILKKIGKLDLPYNFYFHQVVNDIDQHLYMKVIPRGSVWAGVEIGSGIVINPITPEEAAGYYRK